MRTHAPLLLQPAMEYSNSKTACYNPPCVQNTSFQHILSQTYTHADMNNCRAYLHSKLSTSSPHPASASSSSSCSYPSPSPNSPAPTPPLNSSSSPSQQSDHHPAGCRNHSSSMALRKLRAAQRKHAFKRQCSLPPLSPQESCTLSFSDSASSTAPAQVFIPPTDQPSFPLFHVPAAAAGIKRHFAQINPKQGSFSSLLVHGTESPASITDTFGVAPCQASPVLSRCSDGTGSADFTGDYAASQSALHPPAQRHKMLHKSEEDRCASADSKRLKCALEDLEKELLGDDPDISVSSFMAAKLDMADASSLLLDHSSLGFRSTCESSAIQDPESYERDWTDAIEDFLCRESSSPSTTVDQSTITSTTCSSGALNKCTIPHRPMPSSSTTPCHAIKELLLECAKAVDNDDYTTARANLSSLEQYVSIYGDPMQRVAAHMAAGLAARMELAMVGGESRRLLQVQMREAASPTEILRSEQALYQRCLHFKFGYLSANASIAEACRNERGIHIIDFGVGQGNQWPALISAFAQRPGGPPHIRITGVADPRSPTNLMNVAKRLEETARKANVPLQFHQLQMESSEVEPWMLQIQPGEAVAVNFAFHLHKMADESVSTSNPRDGLLRKVRAMQPKIVTLVEHDANTNTAPFYPRFIESLDYFSAVFESLDMAQAWPRDGKERVDAEKHCLSRDMMNIVACEGAERLQRYEKAGKWRARMTMAGFRSVPASVCTSRLIKELLVPYSSKYRVREEVGALHLQWLDQCLVATSAWQ